MLMVLAIIAIITTFLCSILAGRGEFSFWWVLMPAFLSALLQMLGNPAHMETARKQKAPVRWAALTVLATTVMSLLLGGVVFGVARLIS